MRKNSTNNKRIKGAYYTLYEIKTVGADNLINLLKRRGLTLINVKKHGKKTRFSVLNKDNEKIIEIKKELCYTDIVKIKDYGKFYFVYFLRKNLGLLLGGIFFIFALFFADGYIFDVSFTGTGAIYKREVSDFIESKGVKKLKRFSEFDLDLLADEILQNNSHLTFASCQKKGNTLLIELALSNDKVKVIKKQKQLISPYNGIIENIKVYRGTALFNVNDTVKRGDVIVDGYSLVKEERVELSVIASVSLIVKESKEFISSEDNKEDYFLLIFKEENSDKDVIKEKVTKSVLNGKFVYKTEIDFRYKISVE